MTKTTVEVVLYWLRQLVIDYEFSETPEFDGHDIERDVKWKLGESFRFDKSEKRYQTDMCFLKRIDGSLYLHHTYVNGIASHYDAGEVPYDSVRTVSQDRFLVRPTPDSPCLVNHVYVVRTYHGHYAKFILREIQVEKHKKDD